MERKTTSGMGSAGPGESDRDNNGNSCKHSGGAHSRPAAVGPCGNSTVSWKIKPSQSLNDLTVAAVP